MNRQKSAVVLRTLFFAALIAALTFTTLAAGSLLSGQVHPMTASEGIPSPDGPLRALTVRTGENGDFPSAPNITAKAQEDQLDEIAAFAETYGFNAVFFEAVPDGAAFYRSRLLPASAGWMGRQGQFTFFDPLAYLTDVCREKNIQVYAVVNPFSAREGQLKQANVKWTKDGFPDPASEEVRQLAADVAGELSKNYDIAGVILSGVDSDRFESVENYPARLGELTAAAKARLRDKSQRLGMVVRPPGKDGAVFDDAASNGLDFLVTSGAPDPVTEYDSFMEQLSGWRAYCEQKGLAFYPLHSAGDDSLTTHTAENSFWLESKNGAGGLAVSSYGALNTGRRLAAVSLAASFREQPDPNMPDFSYPQTFAVTRPSDTLYLDYTWESYFVTGTSAPGSPVTADCEAVEPTATGLWGHLVPLAYGTNKFTFSQDGVSKTVAIVRSEPPDGKISTIRASSAYPGNGEAVLEGRALKLSCTAPAGGNVTATVGGLSVPLRQAAAGQEGTAAVYQGQLDVSSLGVAGQVTNVGPVTYQLSFNGTQNSQQSTGSVYVVGAGATPVARMKLFGTMVNANAADDGQYATILRQGCVDVITDNAGGYYGLSLGGYILKSAVEIVTGSPTATNEISRLTMEKTGKGEKIILSGTQRPAYKGALTDESLTINLRNISGWEKVNTAALPSDLCSSIESRQNDDGSVTIVFQFKPDARIAGWDVLFDDENRTAIYLRQKPDIDWTSNTPLAGVTIALDPGHGGSDPGAMGVPGTTGPAENLMNLANSYALRSRLTALGADVHILQENTDSSLDQRLQLSQQLDADLFISSHHNSLSETVDSNSVSGVEVYYWNDWSAGFADNIGQNLSAQTGRKLRAVTQSWYRVTMMYACPAVLVESGFVCNPSEYESLASDYAMYRYASAVTDAVLQYLAE